MIIDLILDRRAGDKYDPRRFYVEVSSNAECEAIKRFLTDNGFRCAVYHHPASGRPIGYKVML